MFPRHQGRSRWCAQRSDVIIVQNQARVSQNVDIRRWNLCRPVETDIVPALHCVSVKSIRTMYMLDKSLRFYKVIRQDEDDMRSSRFSVNTAQDMHKVDE